MAPTIEVYDKVKANKGFMVGESYWNQLVDAILLKNIANRWDPTGPQGWAEQILYDIEYFADGTKYIHGCAGFAGDPKGSLSYEAVEALSHQIEAKIGKDRI